MFSSSDACHSLKENASVHGFGHFVYYIINEGRIQFFQTKQKGLKTKKVVDI